MAPSILESQEIFVPEKYCGSSNINQSDIDHGEQEFVEFVKPGLHDLAVARDASRDFVLGVLKGRAASVDVHSCVPGAEDPFYVADLGEVYRQHLRWKLKLRRVKPFYGEFRLLPC